VTTVTKRDARWSPSARARDRVIAAARGTDIGSSLTSHNSPATVLGDALRAHAAFTLDTSDIPTGAEATPQREQQLENYQALQRFIRTQSIASVCRQVTATAWG